jgi:hypothetical protein
MFSAVDATLVTTSIVVSASPSTTVTTTKTVPKLTKPKRTIKVVRPKIVVLVHGMLTAGDKAGDFGVGELKGFRNYWAPGFVRGILMGGNNMRTNSPLYTLDNPIVDISSLEDWVSSAEGVTWHDGSEGKYFVHAAWPVSYQTYQRNPGRGGISQLSVVARPPDIVAMTTSRDSTVGLIDQSKQAIDQISDLLIWYENKFSGYLSLCNCKPELIFVAHSMGGLVSRFLFSNPDPDLLEDPILNPDGLEITNDERALMNTIRNRVLFLTTLSTPHEGSHFAEIGNQVIEAVESGVEYLEASGGSQVVDETVVALADTWNSIPYWLAVIGGVPGSIVGDALPPIDTSGMTDIARNIVETFNPSNGQIRDLMETYWLAVNQELLQPEKAMRTANADQVIRGTANTLIPVYALGGRSPGSYHFNNPNIFGDFESYSDALAENKNEQNGVLIPLITDMVLAHVSEGGWGEITEELSLYETVLDRVDRASFEAHASVTFPSSGLADLIDPLVDLYLTSLSNELGLGDFTIPVEFIATSGPGVFDNYTLLFNGELPVYLREEWGFNLDSTVDIPVPVLACNALGTENLESALILSGNEVARALLTILQENHWSLAELASSLTDPLSLFSDFMVIVSDLEIEIARDLTEALSAVVADGGARDVNCLNLANWELTFADMPLAVPGFEALGGTASDGEMDSDGVVNFNSSMGMQLGTDTPLYFDHTQQVNLSDGRRTTGSWYRYFRSPVEDESHISMTLRQTVGAFVHNEFIRRAGPIPSSTGLSVYP